MKHPKHEKTWRGQNKHAKNLKPDNLAWIHKDLEIWHNAAGQQTIGQRMNEDSEIKWMNEMTWDHGINLVLKNTSLVEEIKSLWLVASRCSVAVCPCNVFTTLSFVSHQYPARSHCWKRLSRLPAQFASISGYFPIFTGSCWNSLTLCDLVTPCVNKT